MKDEFLSDGRSGLDRFRALVDVSAIMKRPKHPPHADLNQLSKSIVDAATDEAAAVEESQKAAAGQLGGKVGGTARAESLSAEQRAKIARKAARKRWQKSKDETVPEV